MKIESNLILKFAKWKLITFKCLNFMFSLLQWCKFFTFLLDKVRFYTFMSTVYAKDDNWREIIYNLRFLHTSALRAFIPHSFLNTSFFYIYYNGNEYRTPMKEKPSDAKVIHAHLLYFETFKQFICNYIRVD